MYLAASLLSSAERPLVAIMQINGHAKTGFFLAGDFRRSVMLGRADGFTGRSNEQSGRRHAVLQKAENTLLLSQMVPD